MKALTSGTVATPVTMTSKRDKYFPWLWDCAIPIKFRSIPKPIGIHNQTQMIAGIQGQTELPGDAYEVAVATQGLETMTERMKVEISHLKVWALLG